MAQSDVVVGSVQQTLQQNVDVEPVPLKRKKRDSGTPAGKSVVVLKSCDVTIGDNYVRMPNTIEMARLKKKEKGQFLTNVQISSKMTQKDIRELLISLFPYLGDQRFYCASAVDNRTRLDFHGERRIWDGRLIKQKIKGNSALYIYTDEGSSGTQDSISGKQLTLKRPHDQMMPTMQSGCRIDQDDVSLMTQGGICAPSVMTQNIVSTASQSQSRKPAMHIADGQAAGRNTVPSKSSLLPNTDVQGMVSSSLTPQLNSLSIVSAASEEERGQLGQTAALGYDLAHVPLQATTRQGQGNGAATRMLVIPSNSTDQSKRVSVVSAEVDQCAGKSGNESNATDVHQEYSGTSGSDFESQLSDSAVERPSDSGIEGSDNLFIVDDTVVNICPGSGSVKGGIGFYIALDKALPDEVKKGVAVFEGVAAVTVDKTNSLVLSGTVPPSQEVGEVPVTVTTESGKVIGYTMFIYKDDVNEMVKQIVEDRTLQSEFFAKLSKELAKENLASDLQKTEALGPVHVPHVGKNSSVKTKQTQSVELLQLLDYNAAKRDARWFIETVTSAGKDPNYYEDRTPWPENVAPAHGNVELAPLQDVHSRLSPNRNAHSTLIDWLELEEAVQKQSLATLESHTRVDLSDGDDDESSDYFADAETSSCGSFDDEIGWCGISENKEPCVQDEISSEVQNVSEYDDLPMPFLSRASFTKDERIIEESTKGESSSEYIFFAGKQSSSCLDKEETGEFSELSKFFGINPIKVISVKPKASEIKNERVTEEESTQEYFTSGFVIFVVGKAGYGKSVMANSYRLECLRDAIKDAISDPKVKGVLKCLAREFGVSGMTLINVVVNKCRPVDWNQEREKFFSHLKLLMKEQHLLEREQLFAMERLLAQKLSTRTEQLLSVRLMKRVRKFQGTYEVSGDPVCKSVNSYEGEPKEVALAILFELFLDPVAAQTCLESTLGVRNSKINQTDKENQQIDKDDCDALKLCKAGRGAQATYETVQTSLDVNDVQLEDLAVGFRGVLHTKPLECNLRKTDEITVETLFDLSCDLRKEWKNLAFALGVRDATNDRVGERNQTLREKCYNMLLLWKQKFGPQATYKALEVGLCHDSVRREDLVKKYCHGIISSAMQ